ncbi:MAG TPA: hypothetical protein DEO38_01870 [Bacteroidales bacterium]|nr:hypothetical protein [Bacteroidales bacterium]
MKHRTILTTLFASILYSAFAQTITGPHVGKVTISNVPLNFHTQVFDIPEDLIGAGVNSNDDYIFFSNLEQKEKDPLYRKIEYSVYHLPDMQKLFYKKYNSGRYYYSLVGSRPYLLRFDVNRVACLDINTGKKVWSTSGRFVRILNDNIIMFSRGIGNMGSTIDVLSLETGKKQWSVKMGMTQGISYNYTIDENSDFIVANELCRINWATGELKQLESKTSITDKAAVLGGMLGGVYYGPRGGTMGTLVGSRNYYQPVEYAKVEEESERPFNRSFFMYPEYNIISGLTSGIARCDGRNYYADRNSIRCFDDDMNELWNTPFQVKATRSDVFLRGDTVYMINLAMGIYGSRGMSPREHPYVAAFSATDGHQLFYKEWDKKKSPITASTIIDDKLHMLSLTREVIFDLATQKVDVVEVDTTEGGGYINYALTDYIFKRDESDSSFTAVNVSSNSRPVLTMNGCLIDIKPVKPKLISSERNTFYCIGHTKDYALLRGGLDYKELWFVRNGKATLLSKDVDRIIRKKDKIFMFTKDNKLSIITIEP